VSYTADSIRIRICYSRFDSYSIRTQTADSQVPTIKLITVLLSALGLPSSENLDMQMAIIHAHTWKLCLTWTKSGKLGCLEKNTMVWEALISGDYVLLKVLYLSSKPVYFF